MENDLIVPPQGSYFIHGFSKWSKNHFLNFIHPQISVSLQQDNYTVPLRPIGFILEIKKNGIIAAFDRDVCSKLENGKKIFAPWSPFSKNYKDLEDLLKNTTKGKHNELWVYSSHVEIVSGYILGKSKSFEKQMQKKGFSVHKLPFPTSVNDFE